jgi:hypothetical protein
VRIRSLSRGTDLIFSTASSSGTAAMLGGRRVAITLRDPPLSPRRGMVCLGRDQKMEKRHASRRELFVVGAIFQ